MVEALTQWPGLSSSPWIRWYPQPCSRWRAAPVSVAVSVLTGGRPVWLGIGPFPADQATVPARHGAPCDQPVRPQARGQQPDQRCEDRPLGPVHARPGTGAAQHGDLVPQHEQFDILRCR
jgi:hypothetical protein